MKEIDIISTRKSGQQRYLTESKGKLPRDSMTQKSSDKKYRSVANDSSVLKLVADIRPASSKNHAMQQVGELCRNFFPTPPVAVELISSGIQNIVLSGDKEPVSLPEITEQGIGGLVRGENSYIFMTIDEENTAVITMSSDHVSLHDQDEPKSLFLLAPIIRLILQNGILAEEKREMSLQGERVYTELEKTEQYFKFLYENIPSPYQSLGNDGEIIEVNKAWLEVLGYDENEVIGKSFKEFLPEDQHDLYHSCIDRLKETGEVRNVELEVSKKNGTSITIQLDGALSIDAQRNILSSHFIFLDVSEQNRIRELILQSEKLSTIAGLAAGIAHEINTPLSGIMQSVQLIEMFLDPRNETNARLAKENGVDLNDLQKYLQQQDLDYFIDGIRGSAIKASRIIRSLLNFSRPTDAEFEFVSLPDLVELVTSLIHTDYDLKKNYDVMNITINTEYDPEVPLICCVPVEIEQVILNIVKNSVHALGKRQIESPLITIRTSKIEEYVRIEVEDNGPGIPHKTIKHAFDPFFTTKGPGEGTGLGLSVAYTFVVEKHKGKIWFDSNIKKGTRVVVELPINLQETPSVSN